MCCTCNQRGESTMIFQQYRGHLLVVRQPDHGVQTGLFASHWGNEETPPFTPREPVIAAGTRHDDGWKAWEEEHPTLDPSTGHPWQFYTLTPHEHVPLYRRGIAMAAQHDPTTGLLVSCTGPGCTTTATAPVAWPSGSSAPPSKSWWASSWPSRRSFSSPWPS